MIVEPPPSVLTLGGDEPDIELGGGAMPNPPTGTAVAADVGGGARPNATNPEVPLSPLIVPPPVALSDPDPDLAAPCAILFGMFTVTVPLSE
jgi:hypothetical protein|mmetsp:Transcript_2785/g.7398  ORF Transcript_2785/g.7398 Transcript_2785/m.7398 type:complete len:92 (+) Transcript_2785:3709-3984(+)